MKRNQITESSIKELVDAFYIKVRQDHALGPVFDGVIGTTSEAWKTHLQRMYAFWSSLMLRSRKYKGNPHQKHKDLPTFDLQLFDRWLSLFAQTVREIHTEEVATMYIERSEMIASSLKLSVEIGQKERQ
ncbi:MAG: group III truncated hemoglobin [Bdellovibrionales bacterium]|nr:group III truncated hemoglobin [Bdellovibrionales bacterium]